MKKTISSQILTNNGKWKILEKISLKEDNKYIYRRKLECVRCGNIKIVDARSQEVTICSNCKDLEKINTELGKVMGTYKIISFSHQEEYIKFYNVICTYCGAESVQSISHLRNNPGSCMLCKYERRNITPTLDAPRNCVKSTYISGAKSRNLDFLLTDEEFDKLIFSNCYFCGEPPKEYQSDLKFNKTGEVFKRNGIDRLNSDLGYFKENVVTCCPTCNLMKMTLHSDIFIKHINKIYANLLSKGSTTIETESGLDLKE